jgi:hypothetical protein
MFQYAFARAFADYRKDELVLCIALLRQAGSGRHYLLDNFRIEGNVVNTLDILRGLPIIRGVIELDSRFHPEVFDEASRHILLQGNWESEKYFLCIKDLIRKYFEFRLPPTNRVMNMLPIIRDTESVCIHIRRTDVLLEKYPHGFVGIDYYDRAIAWFAERLVNPVFFVFSDDILWCRNNLKIRHTHHYVSGTVLTDVSTCDDLRLMTACNSFIIANSTFSWWAAWLGTASRKLVIAPVRWFREEGSCFSWFVPRLFFSADLVPDEWIRM